MARLYRRTDAGRKAWDTQSSQVALDYRRVLGLVTHDIHPRDLGEKLGWSEAAVNEILEELEALGLVDSTDTSPDRTDLDFTGRLFIAELQAAQRRAQQELDFTGPLKLDDLRAALKK